VFTRIYGPDAGVHHVFSELVREDTGIWPGTAREIVARMDRLEVADCAFMKDAAEGLVEKILEEHYVRDREYDGSTGRGKTQGVVWPPKG
jgi:hypothetical protein